MTNKHEIYKCEICGNIIEVLHQGQGTLVCCGKPMILLSEKTIEQGTEKHKPIIQKNTQGVEIKVGSIPHPMEDNHYIEFIQLIKEDKVIVEKRLYPGDKPEAEFCIDDIEGITARELCNVHGLWTSR